LMDTELPGITVVLSSYTILTLATARSGAGNVTCSTPEPYFSLHSTNWSLCSARNWPMMSNTSAWFPAGATLWGNGSTFDNVILSNAYRAIGVKQPWDFWNDRCYRTLKSLYPHVKLERSGVAHNALDDAKSQAMHAVRIINATKVM